LQVLLVIVGFGVVTALVAMVWNARHDTGLVVEAFAVPPELEARGYTGSVVAQKVLDRIAELQKLSANYSRRASQSYEINWGNDFKVEIPETGISLGEFNRYLRQWLGHETRISGEVVQSGNGLAVQARAGADPVKSVSGSADELDALIDQIAEHVFAVTQPYRYAGGLLGLGRIDEAITAYAQLAHSDAPATERAWAYAGLSRPLATRGRIVEAIASAQVAVQVDPDVYDGWQRLWYMNWWLGRWESALHYAEKVHAVAEVKRDDVDDVTRESFGVSAFCNMRLTRGDDLAGAAELCGDRREIVFSAELGAWLWRHVDLLAMSHDIAGAKQAASTADATMLLPSPAVGASSNWRAQGLGDIALAEEDFPTAEKVLEQGEVAAANITWPLNAQRAYARAMQGDITGAEQLIRDTPADCYPCLRMRGKIASLKKAWPEAERWFAEAAKQGPSLPFANTDYAEMLLAKGDADGAVAQAREAVKRGPKFADAYQVWGEALMAKNDYSGAMKQFDQATKFAPKWGRARIQWGIALAKLGRIAEAQEKLKQAEALVLAPSEKTLLAGNRQPPQE
jgi:tetratricopeptide (TPR) repeat protein